MAEPKQHPQSKRFHELIDLAGELHDLKQKDYGRDDEPFANVKATAEWGIPPWVGAMIRLNDKVARLKSLAARARCIMKPQLIHSWISLYILLWLASCTRNL